MYISTCGHAGVQLPVQLNPSPEYPVLQLHVKLPSVLLQLALESHGSLVEHSSISAIRKIIGGERGREGERGRGRGREGGREGEGVGKGKGKGEGEGARDGEGGGDGWREGEGRREGEGEEEGGREEGRERAL